MGEWVLWIWIQTHKYGIIIVPSISRWSMILKSVVISIHSWWCIVFTRLSEWLISEPMGLRTLISVVVFSCRHKFIISNRTTSIRTSSFSQDRMDYSISLIFVSINHNLLIFSKLNRTNQIFLSFVRRITIYIWQSKIDYSISIWIRIWFRLDSEWKNRLMDFSLEMMNW